MKLIKRIVISLIVLLVIGWLFDITTPKQCKVPLSQMSQGCINLLYPR